MEEKLRVGILGATGMVGQRYISLLENHPWFKVVYTAASPRSAGKQYKEAVVGRWHMDGSIPKNIERLIVGNARDIGAACAAECDFVFSALELDKEATRNLETSYAKEGIPVVSNSSAHRWTPDVPMIIPEINPHHLSIIPKQQENNNYKGFIVVKPNCSVQSYLTPVHALMHYGFKVKEMVITTMQAISGGGHPGVASMDILENIIPYISGEDEKSEQEPLKILGEIGEIGIENYQDMKISAQCNRVPVIDGHLASVAIKFEGKAPELGEIIDIWEKFRGSTQSLNLPSAPEQPIIYRPEIDRPQPRKDRDAGNGMAISVGGLRKDNVMDIRFLGLSHNTIRGAAGGGILNAELLKSRGYFNR